MKDRVKTISNNYYDRSDTVFGSACIRVTKIYAAKTRAVYPS